MPGFMMSGSLLMMSHKVTVKEIGKIADRLDIVPAEPSRIVEGDSANVAVIQLECKQYQSLAEYVIDMNLYIADAVNRRADLICFPAFSGMLPLSFLPQSQAYIQLLGPGENGLPDLEKLVECLSAYSDVMFDAFYNTMSVLSERHNTYIMAGTVLFFEEDELRHRALLFGPDGELAGYQDKISCGPLESALRIDPATEIKTFETPAGITGILTTSDAGYFEAGRILKACGAKLALHPTCFTSELTPMDRADGLNLRVQENTMFGVQSTMVGNVGNGLQLHGPCSFYAPYQAAGRRNGILGETLERKGPDILIARLDYGMLEQVRSPYLHDFNPGLMNRYADRLY